MEIWKDIKGFEGKHQISNYGNVRSLPYMHTINIPGKISFQRLNKGKVLTPRVHSGGYLRVQISRKDYYIHRLVADAFLPYDDSRNEVNHIDSNKKNNHLENLERCDRSENLKHGYRVGHRTNPGTGKFGRLNRNSRGIIAIQDTAIIECESQNQLAKALGVCHQTVSEALALGNKCVGFNLYRA